MLVKTCIFSNFQIFKFFNAYSTVNFWYILLKNLYHCAGVSTLIRDIQGSEKVSLCVWYSSKKFWDLSLFGGIISASLRNFYGLHVFTCDDTLNQQVFLIFPNWKPKFGYCEKIEAHITFSVILRKLDFCAKNSRIKKSQNGIIFRFYDKK